MNANEQRPMIKRFGQHKRCVRARLLTQSSQLTATSGTLRGLRVVTAAVGPSVAGSGGKKKKRRYKRSLSRATYFHIFSQTSILIGCRLPAAVLFTCVSSCLRFCFSLEECFSYKFRPPLAGAREIFHCRRGNGSTHPIRCKRNRKVGRMQREKQNA